MGRGKIQWGAFTSGKIQWGVFTITGLLDMKRELFPQMGRGKIQWGAFTVQLQHLYRSVTQRKGQTVAFRRSATPAKRKIGPACVPQEVGGLAAWRSCQAQMHVTRPKTFWAPGLEVKQALPQAGEGLVAKQARPQAREGLEAKQVRPTDR